MYIREIKNIVGMQEIIKKFFKTNKQLMGVSITPEAGIEAILFDGKSKTVKGYSHKDVPFNQLTKMPEDDDEFSQAIEEIMNDLSIVPGTPVIINLPSFIFGFLDTDTVYDQTESGIYSSIVSEVEQSYMFKQNVPIPGYAFMNSNLTGKGRIAYCAVQKALVERVKEIFYSLELVPVAIENSYSSIMKTVEYFGLASSEMSSSSNWGLISINQNSYSIFSFVGNNLTDIYEDPVAIKTFEKDEVNYAVASVINSNLQYYNFSSLIIVNNSSDINAQELAKQFDVSGCRVSAYENNGKRAETFFNASAQVVNDVQKISMFVLGAAIYNLQEEYILRFNLNDSDGDDETQGDFNFLGVPIELNDENYVKILVLIFIVCAIPFGAVFSVAKYLDGMYTTETSKLNNEIAEFERRIAAAQIPKDTEVKFNPIDEIAKIVKSNEYNLSCYGTLGVEIPPSMWLTYFYGNQDSATLIRGRAYHVEDVYRFYRSVKSVLNNDMLSLSKISLVSDFSSGRDAYEFEITNNMYDSILDALKSHDKDYLELEKGLKELVETDYQNSYLPTLPVSDGTVVSPIVRTEAERQKKKEEAASKLKEKDVKTYTAPGMLPPNVQNSLPPSINMPPAEMPAPPPNMNMPAPDTMPLPPT